MHHAYFSATVFTKLSTLISPQTLPQQHPLVSHTPSPPTSTASSRSTSVIALLALSCLALHCIALPCCPSCTTTPLFAVRYSSSASAIPHRLCNSTSSSATTHHSLQFPITLCNRPPPSATPRHHPPPSAITHHPLQLPINLDHALPPFSSPSYTVHYWSLLIDSYSYSSAILTLLRSRDLIAPGHHLILGTADRYRNTRKSFLVILCHVTVPHAGSSDVSALECRNNTPVFRLLLCTWLVD